MNRISTRLHFYSSTSALRSYYVIECNRGWVYVGTSHCSTLLLLLHLLHLLPLKTEEGKRWERQQWGNHSAHAEQGVITWRLLAGRWSAWLSSNEARCFSTACACRFLSLKTSYTAAWQKTLLTQICYKGVFLKILFSYTTNILFW